MSLQLTRGITMTKIKVMIADDHSMLRMGLKQILELEEDIEVIAQASDGDEALSLAETHLPDIILMDINMPGTSGLEAIEKLSQKTHPPKVIMLTIHQDREYLFKTLNLGAKGYVLKDAEPDILLEAIRNVYNGESYIQSNMTKELINEYNRVTSNEKGMGEESSLTSREIEVLKLIAQGMLNKEIASALQISEKTVKNHVSNIFRKLNVYDRTQAAIYALKHNMN